MRKLTLIALVLGVGACSADFPPRSDGQAEKDKSTPKSNVEPIGDSKVLPWTDGALPPDTAGMSCTPGFGMCDDNKTLQCVEGKCVPCPDNYVDCDRQGDCECLGACKGDSCVTKPPKN